MLLLQSSWLTPLLTGPSCIPGRNAGTGIFGFPARNLKECQHSLLEKAFLDAPDIPGRNSFAGIPAIPDRNETLEERKTCFVPAIPGEIPYQNEQ